MRSILVVSVCAVTMLTACSDSENRIPFDGQFFRTNVAKVDGQRDVFTVRVRDVSRSLDGAREAGRHAGISYCVDNYGSSKIDWTVGPDTPPEELEIDGDAIVFQGVCPQV